MSRIRGAGLAVLISQLAFGQAPAPRPAFDVTSVKPHEPGGRPGATELGCSPSGRFAAVGLSVAPSIRWAYIAGPYQVSLRSQLVGLPDWVNSRAYDVEGRTEAPVTEAQCRLMAQSLLADRFKLAVHLETKSLPVSVLVVAKGGPKPKLKKAVDSDSDKGVFVNGAAMVGSSPKGYSMADLALLLSAAVRSFGGGGPMVVDRTGLDGVYRFSLDFAVKGVNAADEVAAALQEQLGLKIETRDESVEVVVVDHIEKPDAN